MKLLSQKKYRIEMEVEKARIMADKEIDRRN